MYVCMYFSLLNVLSQTLTVILILHYKTLQKNDFIKFHPITWLLIPIGGQVKGE